MSNNLVKIFKDTLECKIPEIEENRKYVMENSKFYQGQYVYGCNPNLYNGWDEPTKITVTKERSFESAMRVINETKQKTAVLNFADAITPGGLVWVGATTQEECLCRESTLYSAISQDRFRKLYYGFNDRHNLELIGSDAIIYTPNSIIFKTDEELPVLMEKEQWVTVDIITCAAPNNYNLTLGDDVIYNLQKQRAEKILKCAFQNGAKNIITGAFGCGAFMNEPSSVARAWRDSIIKIENQGYHFNNIVFAIYCKNKNKPSRNYTEFERIFQF